MLRRKFDPPINTPTTIKLLYFPTKSQQGEYGEFWLFMVEENGEEKVWFANSAIQEELSHFKRGDSVVVVKKENRNEKTGRVYYTYTITQALFQNSGEAIPVKPDLVKNDDARLEFRKQRMQALEEAYIDTLDVIAILEKNASQLGLSESYIRSLFTPDAIQRIVVSLLIDYNKRIV